MITKPAVAAGGAPALGVISEAERRALAAMPLPKLPTLVPRETPATSIAAAAAAEAALPPAPAPSTKPSAAVESPTATEIRSLLSKANERTGLDDVQLARIAQFQATAARGEQETALVGLLRLNDELDAAYNSYNVGHGESLWQIAAKPETYGNANLWPLIWRANPRALPQPRQVKNGQKLRVPRYPSLTAVTEALDYAASHPVEKQ
ncbi:MAG: LysM peptidoglycan-binding domain-containing protein [Nevskia sp.]|nr:LysM peptidoglycan-binding domain-containing protein [Nevskia sp.]